jgi:hypothetical protein
MTKPSSRYWDFQTQTIAVSVELIMIESSL